MKKILIVFCIVACTIKISAQQLEFSKISYGSGHTMYVIHPNISNFITLLSLNETQFIEKMKQFKYFEESSDGKYISYWNGSLDNYTYTKCVNTFMYNVMRDEIRFMVSREMVYPSDVITSLFRDLKPYYKDSRRNADGNSIDLFGFKSENIIYEFYITTHSTFFDVLVLKKQP